MISRRALSILAARKGAQPAAAPQVVLRSAAAAGINVVAADDQGPSSALAICVSAGARCDPPTAPGAAFLLKQSILRRLPGDNVARTIRETELRGNSLHSSVSREHIILASEFLRDDLIDAVPTLLNNLFNPSFEPYELLDAVPPAVNLAAAALADPSIRVLESLHSTAFRSGLGNPLFPSSEALHSLSRANLLDFAKANFTPDRITIVGNGVALDDLVPIVDKTVAELAIPSSSASSSASASKFHSGDARIDLGPNSATHYVLAFPGSSYTGADYHASLVLKNILGGSPHTIQWGSRHGSTGLFANLSTPETTARAIYIPYSDAGLFGVYVHGASTDVQKILQGVKDTLKSIASNGVSNDALASAKKAATIELEGLMTRTNVVDAVANGVVGSGLVRPTDKLRDVIEKVSSEDIKKLVKKMTESGKRVTVCAGNLREVPYADEIGL